MFLICTRNFPPDIGGIQNLMEGLSLALLNHGPVKVYADSTENYELYDKNSKLDIHRVSGFKIFKKYRKANLIKDFIAENKIRAVFFDHWKSIEKINIDSLKKTTSFCLIHSKEINHPVGTSLNLRMIKSLQKSDHIIANSNFTKDLAINSGIEAKKIKIIHPGCKYPIQIQKENKIKAQEIYGDSFPRIITVARLDRRKGHQNILMTIKNLIPKFPKIKYVSIGDGDEKKTLEDQKKELSLEEEVVLLHNVDEGLKVALLNESDLFLMPSIVHKKSVEGFGISFVEAASFGVGSIGGIFGGEKDAIDEGETGYLCDGNDLNSLYETILKFYNNENYKKFSANALEFSKKFTWNKIIKKYIDLI